MGKAKLIVAVVVFGMMTAPATGQGFLKKLEDATGGGLGKLGIGSGGSSSVGSLTDGEIGTGLKEALRVGTDRLVGQLGSANGFNGDPQVHIPLPASLKKVQPALSRFGMSGMADDLELKLNRAAEAATPKAKNCSSIQSPT